ncbi:TIR domain-containing protein [Bradyrhizobium sp. 143]
MLAVGMVNVQEARCMKERFQGAANRANLLAALRRQEFVGGNQEIAEAAADIGEIVEYQDGEKLITQGAEDNEIFLLLAGTVLILINGYEYERRKPGQHIGEMAAIEPSLKRSATVAAAETVVALKLTSADFMALGISYPQIWLPIAQEVSRRLFQRNSTIPVPNAAPKLFVISSTEAKHVAHALRDGLNPDVFSTVWDDGVFFAGGYPLEHLEKQVAQSDFAIAIAEPDDIVRSRGHQSPTLRDNVLFELGLFMGKLGRHRAIAVHPRVKDLWIPTDLQGLTVIPYEPGDESTVNLRLKSVCEAVRKLVQVRGVRIFNPA